MDYRREYWTEPGYPITGPAPKQATTLAVCHWSGSDSIPTDKVSWLRSMQRDYVDNRGYSLGYWALVCQTGDAYQIRGNDFNSAANKGDKVSGNANDWTAPILFDVRYGEFASIQAIATAKRLWRSWGVTGRPVPHSDLDYTQCCGDALRVQIDAGEFDLDASEPPMPPPPMGDDDMLVNLIQYKADGYPNPQPAVFAQYSGGYKVWIRDGDVLAVFKALNPSLSVSWLPDDWFEAAGPVLPGTPLPYDGHCDAYGRKTF